MRLSNNFDLKEFMVGEAGDKNPKQWQIDNITRLVNEILQPLRDQCGSPIKISSGIRTKEGNAKIGGVPTSQHLYGEAGDFELPSSRNSFDKYKKVFDYVVSSLPYRQVFLYLTTNGKPRFIHVSTHPSDTTRKITKRAMYNIVGKLVKPENYKNGGK